uniref:Uncharacterized protein n=1 Tax=Anopheles coluzzii TaxID=1518534 RepID=A0A8W7PCN7_ANOCL
MSGSRKETVELVPLSDGEEGQPRSKASDILPRRQHGPNNHGSIHSLVEPQAGGHHTTMSSGGTLRLSASATQLTGAAGPGAGSKPGISTADGGAKLTATESDAVAQQGGEGEGAGKTVLLLDGGGERGEQRQRLRAVADLQAGSSSTSLTVATATANGAAAKM